MGLFDKVKNIFRRDDEQRSIAELCRVRSGDRAKMEFYRQFVAPGSLVFDVGANIGNRSKLSWGDIYIRKV